MIEFIRRSVEAGDYEISLHGDEERLAEGLTMVELEAILMSANLLEDYPDDPRGPSCLVLGFVEARPFHAVCGRTRQGRLIVVTVYSPRMPKWKNPTTRSRGEGV